MFWWVSRRSVIPVCDIRGTGEKEKAYQREHNEIGCAFGKAEDLHSALNVHCRPPHDQKSLDDWAAMFTPFYHRHVQSQLKYQGFPAALPQRSKEFSAPATRAYLRIIEVRCIIRPPGLTEQLTVPPPRFTIQTTKEAKR